MTANAGDRRIVGRSTTLSTKSAIVLRAQLSVDETCTRAPPRQGPRILFAYWPTCPQTPLSLKSDHAGLEKSVKPFDVADSDARSLFVEWLP